MASQLNLLTQINLDDLVSSFGWTESPRLAHLLRRLFLHPAQTFAEAMVEFDDAVGAHGLPDASRLLLGRYVREVRVYGHENIPPAAPFLALSNHPGMADTVSLFAAINRADLKIIALDRPFLKALPHTSNQLFYLKDDPAARMTLVRQVSTHLKSGGSALTFPAGEIEPDPNVYAGALEALDKWTDSAGVFLRMAPETVILPTLVRGVIWDKTAQHPLVRIAKKKKEEREKLAAAFQLLAHVQFKQRPVTVTVQIGQPITVEKLGSKETQVIHQAVVTEMRRLIQNPPAGDGECVIGVGSKPISYPISNH